MKKLAIFISLTIALLFVVFELYNISNLYNDQQGMAELAEHTASFTPSSSLNDFKFELNTWRIIYITYIAFYLFYVGRMFWLARKPANN